MRRDLLPRERIVEALEALAKNLSERRLEVEIVVVGGAALALAYDARPATRDVDVLFATDPGVWESARSVAARLALPEDWLNQHVHRVYTNTEVTRASVVFEKPGLRVWSADPWQLLAMKLCAFRDDLDIADAVLLLGRVPRQLDRETVWAGLERYLIRGHERFARDNFEDIWEQHRGSS